LFAGFISAAVARANARRPASVRLDVAAD
jgi:hypothetical protein